MVRAEAVKHARMRIRRVIRGIERKMKQMHHPGVLNTELLVLVAVDRDLEKASAGEYHKRTRAGVAK